MLHVIDETHFKEQCFYTSKQYAISKRISIQVSLYAGNGIGMQARRKTVQNL